MLIVAVGDGADDDALPVVFVRIGNARPVLHVQESAPFLSVAGKALHERGVTVPAGMRAANVRIDRVSSHGKGGFGHDGLDVLEGQRSDSRHDATS